MKKSLLIIAGFVVVAGSCFFGGMKYGQIKSSEGPAFGNFQGSDGLSPEERQQFFQGDANEDFQPGSRGMSADSFSGEVIDKDEQSITIKLPDGGSKIVFFSGSTRISETKELSASDIEIGGQVMVIGEENSDGSYSADMIQVSPFALAQPKTAE